MIIKYNNKPFIILREKIVGSYLLYVEGLSESKKIILTDSGFTKKFKISDEWIESHCIDFDLIEEDFGSYLKLGTSVFSFETFLMTLRR